MKPGSHKKNLIKILTSFILMMFAFSSTYSQTDTTDFNNLSLKDLLNIKVTTASRTLQELGIAPATVIVVTQEQIKIRGYQSLLDLLFDLPDFKVDDKIYPGSRNSISIRGVEGQQNFLILLNGIKISSPTNEAMPIMENYPVNLAKQVEVVYGPASALYGADAVSGVINIITKSSNDNNKLTIDASATGGMYGHTNNTLFISKKLSNKVNFSMSGQYYSDSQPDYSKIYENDPLLNSDHYATGTFNTIYGPISPVTKFDPGYNASSRAYNVFAALNVGNFTVSFFSNNSKLPSSYGSNTSNAIYNKDVFISQSISTGSVSYKKTVNKLTSHTTLIGNQYTLSPKSNYRNIYTALEPAYKYSASTSFKADQQLDYRFSDKLNFTGGGTFEGFHSIPQSGDLNKSVSKSDYRNSSYAGTTSYYKPDGLPAQFYTIRYNNSAAYLQAQYSPVKKLHLTIGARYDDNSRYGSSVNPRLGFVFNANKQTTIKAFYGSAFLAPSPSTTYVQYGSFDTQDSGRTYHSYFQHLPNPGLKPIISHNTELNISQYITNNFSVTMSGYYTSLKGLYTFGDDNTTTRLYNNSFNGIPVDYIEVFINNDRQKNYGGNIQLNWKKSYGKISASSYASLSYVNGKSEEGLNERVETSKDKQLDFIAPLILRVGTDLTAGKFSCSPRLILMGRQNISGISDTTTAVVTRQTIPGYALLNISLRYDVVKRLSVFANITNALNQDYKAVGFNMDLNKNNSDIFHDGQRQDPIRIMGGVNFTF